MATVQIIVDDETVDNYYALRSKLVKQQKSVKDWFKEVIEKELASDIME